MLCAPRQGQCLVAQKVLSTSDGNLPQSTLLHKKLIFLHEICGNAKFRLYIRQLKNKQQAQTMKNTPVYLHFCKGVLFTPTPATTDTSHYRRSHANFSKICVQRFKRVVGRVAACHFWSNTAKMLRATVLIAGGPVFLCGWLYSRQSKRSFGCQ